MNVLQNLTVLYNHLSPESTYRDVCKEILQHLDEAASGTIYDLAELTHSSRTTIWRMIQKLGYSSYTEFHHELNRAIGNYTYYNRILQPEDCESADTVKNALLNQVMTAHAEMEKRIDAASLEKVADLLYNADLVHFYTPFQTSAIYSLQQNLAISGKGTAYCCLIPEIIEESRSLTENSIVFISTIEHAETMNLHSVFESIQKQKAKVLGYQLNKSKYKEFIDLELLKYEQGSVSEGIIVFDTYFYMLSEVYRMKYIEK